MLNKFSYKKEILKIVFKFINLIKDTTQYLWYPNFSDKKDFSETSIFGPNLKYFSVPQDSNQNKTRSECSVKCGNYLKSRVTHPANSLLVTGHDSPWGISIVLVSISR